MRCYCKDEFEWLMKMIEKGDCFSNWEDISEFLDEDFLELRYMNKRFGYLFYDHFKYIKKVNGRNAICVNKEEQFVCRKPDEPLYYGLDETDNKKGYLFSKIPLEDIERYEIKYLDEIDRGEPYFTNTDKFQDEKVKKTKNILKKIKLVKPEIYNSDEFDEVLDSEEFDNIELEKDKKKFYEQVREFVLGEKLNFNTTTKGFLKQE